MGERVGFRKEHETLYPIDFFYFFKKTASKLLFVLSRLMWLFPGQGRLGAQVFLDEARGLVDHIGLCQPS